VSTGPDGVTERYRRLYVFLMTAPGNDVFLTLDEIESILGVELPERAHQDPFWWASVPRNSWARSWLRAGRTARLKQDGTVAFDAGYGVSQFDLERQVAQRRREENYTRSELWCGPDTEQTGRWWEPHMVYILRVGSEGLYKAGITRHDTRRLRDLTARGRADVVSLLLLHNRHAARLVEIAVLDATDSARRVADRFNHRNGQTEHWDDSTPPPALEPVVKEFAKDPALPYWSLSRISSL
jgi:hypothetical protein